MSTPLIWTLLLAAAQASASSSAAAQAKLDSARRDTAAVAVQPPPTIIVEEPSQWPAVVLGVAGLILLGFQLRIMARQTEAMNRQTSLLDKQTVLLDQQAMSRRDEALGTFYRTAFDLADEFRKANVSCGVPIPANYETHPRQMLREASRLFAPLGNSALMAVNIVGLRLDEYFSAVQSYNSSIAEGEDESEQRERYDSVQSFRAIIGTDLDQANRAIPAELRWKYTNGTDYKFSAMCSMPVPLRTSGT